MKGSALQLPCSHHPPDLALGYQIRLLSINKVKNNAKPRPYLQGWHDILLLNIPQEPERITWREESCGPFVWDE